MVGDTAATSDFKKNSIECKVDINWMVSCLMWTNFGAYFLNPYPRHVGLRNWLTCAGFR